MTASEGIVTGDIIRCPPSPPGQLGVPIIHRCNIFIPASPIFASLPFVVLPPLRKALSFHRHPPLSPNPSNPATILNSNPRGQKNRTMSPRKKEVLSAVTATADSGAETAEKSTRKLRQKTRVERIHPAVRFSLAVFSSLALSSTLFTLTTGITLGELGSVSKHLETWWEVGGLMAWKAVEVGLAWILGFDGMFIPPNSPPRQPNTLTKTNQGRDVLSFIFLTHLPTYSLLSTFYGLRPTTTLTSYFITLASTTIPFVLLRSPTPIHSQSTTIPNRSILQDRPTTIYTTIGATAIFTVTLYLSYATTWLPTKLVLHFQDLPDISTVHAGPAGLPVLFLTLLPAGLAARDFLFASSAGASPSKDTKKKNASPEGEYLACTVYRKTWGALTKKTQVLISRTGLLASMLFVNTVIQVAGTVNRVDVEGAMAWGTVWSVAALVTGAMFGWIEAVDGV